MRAFRSSFSALTLRKMQRTVSRVKGALFTKYLLATNTVLSLSSAVLGDALNQHYDIVCGRKKSWDLARARTMTITGGVVGVGYHFWYICLDRCLPGRTVRTAVRKLFLDQAVSTPVCIVMFFACRGALERNSLQSVVKDIRNKWWALYSAELLYRSPIQMINYLFIPTRYKLFFDNVTSVGFDCYYAYVAHRQTKRVSDKSPANELLYWEEKETFVSYYNDICDSDSAFW